MRRSANKFGSPGASAELGVALRRGDFRWRAAAAALQPAASSENPRDHSPLSRREDLQSFVSDRHVLLRFELELRATLDKAFRSFPRFSAVHVPACEAVVDMQVRERRYHCDVFLVSAVVNTSLELHAVLLFMFSRYHGCIIPKRFKFVKQIRQDFGNYIWCVFSRI
jgi:hypothetical protein